MRRLRAAIAVVVVAFAAAQFVQFPLTNPSVAGNLAAPPEVAETLRRACYDCHSNETRWPWFSHIAPASWLAHRHVMQARARLNFSDWADYAYDPGTESHKLGEIAKLVKSGAMPPWYYRLMHPRARLTEADRVALLSWIQREQAAADAKLR
jgi:heme-binding protein